MAMFEGNRIEPGSRSNTKLVVSGGDSPAERFIADPALPVLFSYEYGGPGQKNVVISKGMIVGINGFMKNAEFGKMSPVMTLATSSLNPIGMVPYNISQYNPRFFQGNVPALLTREYIELPYIPNLDDAGNVKYGALHGAGLKPGDLVKVSPDLPGRVTKWNDGEPFSQIVGQVLGMEFDQEPMGWLRWALWDEAAKLEDDAYINRNKNQEPGDNGWPYDANFPKGVLDMEGYLSQFTTQGTGIPGLMDGGNRAQTIQTKSFNIDSATLQGAVLKNLFLGLKNVVPYTVEVYLDGAKQPNSSWSLDAVNGLLTFTMPKNANTGSTPGSTLTVNFKAQFWGTPAGWDFRGAAGAARILLRF